MLDSVHNPVRPQTRDTALHVQETQQLSGHPAPRYRGRGAESGISMVTRPLGRAEKANNPARAAAVAGRTYPEARLPEGSEGQEGERDSRAGWRVGSRF